MSGEPLLAGALVQRVDVAPSLCVLRVRAPRETAYVVVAAGSASGLGVLDARPAKAGAFTGISEGERARWRATLDGARVVGLDAVRVVLERAEGRFAVERDGRRVVLRPVGEAALTSPLLASERAALALRGVELVAAFVASDAGARRSALAQALQRASVRLTRRVAAVGGDLARIEDAAAIASQASAFVAAAARCPRGAASLTVEDWSTGEPRPLVLPLDPSRTARAQLDAMFHRARRLRLGRAVATKRIADAQAARAAIDVLAGELAALGTRADADAAAAMEALALRARAAAPRDFVLQAVVVSRGGSRVIEPPRRSYRTFTGRGGSCILVGKGGADNDELTLHVARPHDLWLHAKGRTGAHVIVPLEKGRDCPADLLVDAAHLAAHFSDAREETVVEVQHTPRRHLRKPKGAAPGLVVTPREKVLVLRVERDRIAELLATEGL